MALLVLDTLTFDNVTLKSEYNDNTRAISTQQVFPSGNALQPTGTAERTYAPGDVMLEIRSGLDRITVTATSSTPYGVVATEANYYPSVCDLTPATPVVDGTTVTLSATSSHPPIQYGIQGQAFSATTVYQGLPYGLNKAYFRDAADCVREVSFYVSDPTPPADPLGRLIDTFGPIAGETYRTYYQKNTSTGARTLVVSHSPGTLGELAYVTEAERGRAAGELITEFCEGADMVQFLSSNGNPFVSINVIANSTSCGYTPAVCSLYFDGYGSKATTSAGSATGQIGVIVETTAGVRQVRLAKKTASGQPGAFSQWANVTEADHSYLFTGLTAGAYFVEAQDNNPLGCLIREEINVAEFARAGCRDPSALNYDPLATQDGVACEYAPVQPTAIFAVPETNSLRFFVPPAAYAVNGPFRSSNNTPWDALQQPGVAMPGYCQKVAKEDVLTIQFKSNFASHFVQLRDKATNAVVRSFPVVRIVQGLGSTKSFAGYLAAHTSDLQARVYFKNGLLPVSFVQGNRILIGGTRSSLDGNYPILRVSEDAAAGVPYLVIDAPYGQVTADERLDCSVTTTFDVQKYDTWQTTLSFGSVAKGCYCVVITATGNGLGSIRAVSEPLDVATNHPGTVLITYRNNDNAFSINYTHGIAHRLRVTGRLWDSDDVATTKDVLVGSDSRTHLLASTARLQARLLTFQLPSQLHAKLSLAFAHDVVTVQGIRYTAEGKYERTAQEKFGLWNGQVVLTQYEWLGAGNSDDLGDLNQGQGFIQVEDGLLRI